VVLYLSLEFGDTYVPCVSVWLCIGHFTFILDTWMNKMSEPVIPICFCGRRATCILSCVFSCGTCSVTKKAARTLIPKEMTYEEYNDLKERTEAVGRHREEESVMRAQRRAALMARRVTEEEKKVDLRRKNAVFCENQDKGIVVWDYDSEKNGVLPHSVLRHVFSYLGLWSVTRICKRWYDCFMHSSFDFEFSGDKFCRVINRAAELSVNTRSGWNLDHALFWKKAITLFPSERSHVACAMHFLAIRDKRLFDFLITAGFTDRKELSRYLLKVENCFKGIQRHSLFLHEYAHVIMELDFQPSFYLREAVGLSADEMRGEPPRSP